MLRLTVKYSPVYILQQTNTATATSHLADPIHTTDTSHLDSQISVLGDFNNVKLTKALPNYRQQIKCSTPEGEETKQNNFRTLLLHNHQGLPRRPPRTTGLPRPLHRLSPPVLHV